jgi:GNAT superfamily N-acetyltransferase
MPDAMRITFRPMMDADLSAARYIFREAMDGLDRSQGGEPQPWLPSEPHTLRHLLRTDPGGAWIAEMNGVAVGYTVALIRGDIWFLSQLFVQPDQHGHGIGQELLRRAQDYGRSGGARVFSVVASTSHTAHALYMRAGMFADAIAYRMSGPLAPLAELPAAGSVITGLDGFRDAVEDLDREVYGAERRQDHAHYAAAGSRSGGGASFALVSNSVLRGYCYAVADGGFVAPMAAYDPADQIPLLREAAAWLVEHDVSTGNLFVLSQNRTVMNALLGAGWRSQRWSFLLTSAPFAKFDRYHPAGPALL